MSIDKSPARISAPTTAIIGAGMAGLACADALAAAGHHVTLLDKARGPGGRMSTRRMATPAGEASFDHGAQYFTARDPAFAALVAQWQALGLAARWPQAGHEAWVGVPAMNAPIHHMAQTHTVHWSARVDGVMRDAAGWHLQGDALPSAPFDALVLALPAEQAAVLLAPCDAAMAARARATPSAPCWTLMLALPAPAATPTHTLRDCGPIGWAANNSSKPGRTGPQCWVVQAHPAWSLQHLESDAAWVAQTLLAALAHALQVALPPPLAITAHRWRYARSGRPQADGSETGDQAAGMMHNASLALGVCGDWLLGPRVECAWRSGTLLGHHMAHTPPT